MLVPGKLKSMATFKKYKDRAIFILYNLVILIVFLAITEGILHYWLNHPTAIPGGLLKPIRQYYTEHLRSNIQMEPSNARYDSLLFYTLKPGKSEFSNLEYKTGYDVNSIGLRDSESQITGNQVIAIGDSFTMGWGVDQDSTYSSILEQSYGVANLNAGVSSFGTAREMKLLERIDKSALKTLIIQYHDSDLVENREFHNNGNSLKISPREFYEQTSKEVVKRKDYFFGKHTALVLKFALKNLAGKLEERRATGEEDVKLFTQVLNSQNLPDSVQVLVFDIASYGHGNNQFLKLLATDTTLKHPVHIVEVQDTLTATDYYIIDDHLNAAGHRKVAARIAQKLKNLR